MPAYRLTNKALEDLRSIARYPEQTWGRGQRNKYLSKLDASFQMLVHEPEMGVRAMKSGRAIANTM